MSIAGSRYDDEHGRVAIICHRTGAEANGQLLLPLAPRTGRTTFMHTYAEPNGAWWVRVNEKPLTPSDEDIMDTANDVARAFHSLDNLVRGLEPPTPTRAETRAVNWAAAQDKHSGR